MYLLPLSLAACGSWRRVGTPETPAATPEQVPRVFDPSSVYRQMGLIAEGGALPFVGSVRLLAGHSADSMLAVVALSLSNRGLTFRRDANNFVAEYRVELVVRQGTSVVRQAARDERVRVGSFRETLRVEESVIFEQFVPVPVGQHVLSIVVRDRNSPNSGRHEMSLVVPELLPPAVATPIPIYEGTPRSDLGQPPTFVVNPRSTAEYGTDSLRFYVESYGLSAGTPLVMSAVDAAGRNTWTDTSRIADTQAVVGTIVTVPPTGLAIGRHDFRVSIAGGGVIASAPFLVAFSDRWVVANFDEMISLLRFFSPSDSLDALTRAAPADRPEAWRRFWRDSDPNKVTPENEALDEYFARVQAANERFGDEGVPGWLTDRGEVFITLGEPDEILDRRADFQGRGRVVYWSYLQYRLVLAFVDDAGFGRFRLDPRSRSEYLRILNRVRRDA